MAETANGCLVLHRAGTIAERQKPRAEELEKTFHALLQSASGELFSLDKDLSWKSRSGTSSGISSNAVSGPVTITSPGSRLSGSWLREEPWSLIFTCLNTQY